MLSHQDHRRGHLQLEIHQAEGGQGTQVRRVETCICGHPPEATATVEVTSIPTVTTVVPGPPSPLKPSLFVTVRGQPLTCLLSNW